MQGPQEESVQRVEGEPRNEGSEVVKLKTEGGEKARMVGGKVLSEDIRTSSLQCSGGIRIERELQFLISEYYYHLFVRRK